MIPRRIFLADFRRFLHVSSLVQIKKQNIIAKIDSHEFHKVIKFVRPEILPPWDPRKSCDLKELDPIDPTWFLLKYKPFTDMLNELPEEQRRIFTVEFASRKEGTAIILENMLAETRRHQYDNRSLDFKVTWSTWKIRNYQDIFKNSPTMIRIGSVQKSVKELIDKRRKWLNRMRVHDYKRFEWILEKLGIVYKLTPPYTRVERKAALNVLVNLYCNELRDKKMEEYKQELEGEKVPFLKSKLETLLAIRADEESVGLKSSVDDDIQQTRRLILKLENEHMTILPTNISNDGKQSTRNN